MHSSTLLALKGIPKVGPSISTSQNTALPREEMSAMHYRHFVKAGGHGIRVSSEESQERSRISPRYELFLKCQYEYID